MSALSKIAGRIPRQFIEQVNGRGGVMDYASHSTINQYLLLYSDRPFNLVDVRPITENFLEYVTVTSTETHPGQDGPVQVKTTRTEPREVEYLVGVIATFEFFLDGKVITITEVGECQEDRKQFLKRKDTYKTNAELAKDALSDALKRAAMRVGLGLELWAQDLYFLDQVTFDTPEEIKSKILYLLQNVWSEDEREITVETIEAVVAAAVSHKPDAMILLDYLFGEKHPEDLSQGQRWSFVYTVGESYVNENQEHKYRLFPYAKDLVSKLLEGAVRGNGE